jgi:hypothetical protein
VYCVSGNAGEPLLSKRDGTKARSNRPPVTTRWRQPSCASNVWVETDGEKALRVGRSLCAMPDAP